LPYPPFLWVEEHCSSFPGLIQHRRCPGLLVQQMDRSYYLLFPLRHAVLLTLPPTGPPHEGPSSPSPQRKQNERHLLSYFVSLKLDPLQTRPTFTPLVVLFFPPHSPPLPLEKEASDSLFPSSPRPGDQVGAPPRPYPGLHKSDCCLNCFLFYPPRRGSEWTIRILFLSPLFFFSLSNFGVVGIEESLLSSLSPDRN